MKKYARSEIRLNEAIDLLIAYEAYCMSVGYYHLSFADALNNSKARRIIGSYATMLKDEDCVYSKDANRDALERVLFVMTYVTTGDHLAYTFIIFNIYLRRLCNKECILSYYDLKEVLSRIGKYREYVDKRDTGSVHWCEPSMSLPRILIDSVRTTKEIVAMTEQDSPLHGLSLWMLTSRCQVMHKGVCAQVITKRDNRSVIRENMAFTKLMSKIRDKLFYKYARKYEYDCLDRVVSLLYSLPIIVAPWEIIPIEPTRHNIESFIEDYGKHSARWAGEKITIACDVNERAMRLGDLLIAARYNDMSDKIIMSVATIDAAYVFHISGCQLMDFKSDYFNQVQSDVEAVGKAIDYSIINDHNNMVDEIIGRMTPDRLARLSGTIGLN